MRQQNQLSIAQALQLQNTVYLLYLMETLGQYNQFWTCRSNWSNQIQEKILAYY